MQIPKDKVLEMIRGRGDGDQTAKAETELPGQVDTDAHQSLPAQFGINQGDLIGGLGNKLGR
ncbi:hypothetical protein [Amycolatopsis sp. WQ 127309]|uniref:hypothetical protein n=1 Tax=Amycolatopsis sp. WQ 127309 TaxID=2932773 RepID=UPI001FF60FEF|nr:hypothetical protein [Amycolatopsis sp. WQ 127309]UOZ04884.1 hypothetical protein MUY22_39615 [Amycolatopsis sp. WQ 127309]